MQKLLQDFAKVAVYLDRLEDAIAGYVQHR
jgi:hypothetical protein